MLIGLSIKLTFLFVPTFWCAPASQYPNPIGAPIDTCHKSGCKVSDLSLDAALSTFLCYTEEEYGPMEELEKKAKLAEKIVPQLLSQDGFEVHVETLFKMDSDRLVGLVNLVLHTGDIAIGAQAIGKKTEDQYLSQVIDELVEKTNLSYYFLKQASPHALSLLNCEMHKNPERDARGAFLDRLLQNVDLIPTIGSGSVSNQCKCGIKKEGSKIVGGQEAEMNEYPWIVSLQTKPTLFQSSFHGCGGSLIASRWVITAAHCFYSGGQLKAGLSFKYIAVIGAHDLSLAQEDLRQNIAIEQFIIHENYDHESNKNDIALLRLFENVNLEVYTPICLPESGKEYKPGVKAWIYGWGTLSEGGISPDNLQEVQVPIIDDSECRDSIKNVTGAFISDDRMAVSICAGGSGKNSCQGDSGGPLSVDENGQHQLAGIVSWGYGCAQDGAYGFYADVSVFKTWIDQNIANYGGAIYCSINSEKKR